MFFGRSLPSETTSPPTWYTRKRFARADDTTTAPDHPTGFPPHYHPMPRLPRVYHHTWLHTRRAPPRGLDYAHYPPTPPVRLFGLTFEPAVAVITPSTRSIYIRFPPLVLPTHLPRLPPLVPCDMAFIGVVPGFRCCVLCYSWTNIWWLVHWFGCSLRATHHHLRCTKPNRTDDRVATFPTGCQQPRVYVFYQLVLTTPGLYITS